MKLIESLFKLLEEDGSIASLVHGTEHSELLDAGYKLQATKPGSTVDYPKAYYKKNDDGKVVRVSGLNNTGLHYRVLDPKSGAVLSSHYSAADLLAGRTKHIVRSHAAIQSNGWIHQSTGGKVRTYTHPSYEGHSLKMDISGVNPVFTHFEGQNVVKQFPESINPGIINSYFRSGDYKNSKEASLMDKRAKLTKNLVDLTKKNTVTIDWQVPPKTTP